MQLEVLFTHLPVNCIDAERRAFVASRLRMSLSNQVAPDHCSPGRIHGKTSERLR